MQQPESVRKGSCPHSVLHDRPRHVERLSRRLDVVHAKQARAALQRRDVRADVPGTRGRRVRRRPLISPMNRLRDTPTSTG